MSAMGQKHQSSRCRPTSGLLQTADLSTRRRPVARPRSDPCTLTIGLRHHVALSSGHAHSHPPSRSRCPPRKLADLLRRCSSRSIGPRSSNSTESDPWQWRCGFDGLRPGECTSGTAAPIGGDAVAHTLETPELLHSRTHAPRSRRHGASPSEPGQISRNGG